MRKENEARNMIRKLLIYFDDQTATKCKFHTDHKSCCQVYFPCCKIAKSAEAGRTFLSNNSATVSNITMVAAFLNINCVWPHPEQRANQICEYIILADGTSTTLPRIRSHFNVHYPCIRVQYHVRIRVCGGMCDALTRAPTPERLLLPELNLRIVVATQLIQPTSWLHLPCKLQL